MSTELKQAAQDAAEAIDWLLKNIRLDAPQLSGKAMGNAEKCVCALRIAILQAEAKQPTTLEPVWFHKHWGDDDDIFYRPDEKIPPGSTPLYTQPAPSLPDAITPPTEDGTEYDYASGYAAGYAAGWNEYRGGMAWLLAAN